MSIFSSLVAATGSLTAYSRALEATQNNVTNQATPGYAKQRQTLESLGFDSNLGSGGGVRAGQLQSSRDEYLEQAVRRQTVAYGKGKQDVSSLTALQSAFDISGNSGIPNALSNLFDSFSAWAQSPSSSTAKQTVINRATDLATAFHQTAAAVTNVTLDSEKQIGQTVDQVNHLVGQLREYNLRAMEQKSRDPSLDAAIHSTLEDLSQYVDVTALNQDDGSVNVLLNGETALLVGDRQYSLQFQMAQPSDPAPAYSSSRPLARILAPDGTDITTHSTSGQLGSLLDFRNRILPTYIGDAYQPGSLNQMAQTFADNVNALLPAGAPLFTYDASNPTATAQTFAVDPATTAASLDANDPGPPAVANGIPLKLSAMTPPTDYGDMAARAGTALNDAKNQVEVQQWTVAQAKQLREQVSGVSLDEEATILVQFQRAYEATSKMISVLDQLTQEAINLIRI